MRTITLRALCSLLFLFAFNSSQSQCSPDTQLPTPVCETSVNLALPASGTLILLPEFFDQGSIDNCTSPENLTFSVSPPTVSCADIGTPVPVILTVTDEAGNSDFCHSTAIVEDKTGPFLACETQVNISLPASGEVILTPEMLNNFASDNCDLTYTISPPSVNCDDVGAGLIPYTITATDPGGNSNVCWGDLLVEDKTGFDIACYAFLDVNLPASGILTLTSDMLLAYHGDNCELTYTVSPNQVDCDDVGSTIFVTLTGVDPGGNTNACFADVTVLDPKPDSVNIIPPSSIDCGETGVIFNSTVFGGYGTFTYNWIIKKGADSGWEITSGQGTPSITMNAGSGKLKLKLKVKDLCNSKVKDKYKFKPNCGSAYQTYDNLSFNSTSIKLNETENIIDKEEKTDLSIFPNPVKEQLNINLLSEKNASVEIIIFNNFGKKMMENIPFSSNQTYITLPVSDFPNGIYFIEIRMSNGKSVVRKFVKH